MKKSLSLFVFSVSVVIFLQLFLQVNAAFPNPASAVSDSAMIYQGENLIDFDVTQNDDTSVVFPVGVDLDPSNPGLDTWREYPGVGVIESYNDFYIAFYSDPSFIGIASLEYALWDYSDGSQSNTTTVEIEVLADPNPPLAYDDTCTLATGGTLVCDILGNDDVQNGTFNFSSLDLDTTTPGVQLSATIDAGTLQFNPFTGAFTITATTSPGTYTTLYNISDGAGVSNDATITIEVIINSPPTASDATGASIAPLGSRDILMAPFVSDPEGYVFTSFDYDLDVSSPGIQYFFSTGQGGWSAVDTVSGPVLRFQSYGSSGTSSVTYTVSDQFGNISNQATADVFVEVPPPVAGNDTAIGVDGQTIRVQYAANDNWGGFTSYTNLDFDPVTPGFQYVASTTLGTFEFTTGSTSLVFRSIPGLTGTATTSYIIFNTFGVPSNGALITVTVNPNTSPIANSYTAPSVYPEQTVTISTALLASDPDMTPPFASGLFDLDLVTPGRQQTFNVTQGAWSTTASTLRFQPLSTFLGTFSTPFTFTDDSSAVSNVATVTVVVINENPIAVSDNATGIVDSPKSINVLVNDNPRGGTITFVDLHPSTPGNETATTTPSGTWVVQGDNTILFTPNSGFSGITSIQYAIEDSFGLRSSPATVTVDVESRPFIRLRHGVVAKDQLTARLDPSNVPSVSAVGSSCPRIASVSSNDLQSMSFSSDLLGARAGTKYTGVIVIENIGNLPAYTISVTKDRLEESSSWQRSEVTNVCVMRGDGLELVDGVDHSVGFSSSGGSFFLNSSFGPLAQYSPSSGQNIIMITYDMTLGEYITGHTSLVDMNTYSDSELGVNLANDSNDYTDRLSVIISPTVSDVVTTTTTPNLPISGLTIGQIINYRVEIELPQTGTSSFPTTTTVRLTLPTGMVLYDNNTGTPGNFATVTKSSIVTNLSGNFVPINDGVMDYQLFDFRNVVSSFSTTSTLTLDIPAVVTDIPSNTTSSSTSFVATTEVFQGSRIISSTSSPIKALQEPALVLRNLTSTSTNASGTIDFIFELFQEGGVGDRSPAYDVEFYLQTNGPGLTPLTITNPITGGLPAATTTIGSLFLAWPTISGTYTSSSPITISFTGTIAPTTSTTTLSYPVGLSFSSLPGSVSGPLSSLSAFSRERSYTGTSTQSAAYVLSSVTPTSTPPSTTTPGCIGACGGSYNNPGCTDPLALNYDKWATSDNGSCKYPTPVSPTSTPPTVSPTSTPPTVPPTVNPPSGTTTPITYIPKAKRQLMLQLTGPLEAVQTRLRKDAIRVALSEGNAISIPHIGTKKPVLQLPNLDPLLNEFWMLPWGSTPEKGNNTILVAHSYNQQKGKQWPNVLFDLDKVKIGEKITFDWQGKIYIYEVVDNRQFDAKDVYIEDDTKESVLTIYGCGKYTTKYRQVVRAVLVSVQ